MGIPPSHEKFDTYGMEIFHFESGSGKIKEAWTVFDALTPAMKIGLVEAVVPETSEIIHYFCKARQIYST